MEPIKFNLKGNAAVKRPQAQQQDEAKDFIKDISDNKITSVTPAITKGGTFVIPLAVQGQTKRSKSSADANVTLNNTSNNNNNNTNNNDETKPIVIDDAPEVKKTLDQLAAEAIIKDATMAPVEGPLRTVPLTVQNQIEGIDQLVDDEERFKYDLESRPNEATGEEYDDMPIEEFGFAMLRGMGWAPGAQIGLNNRGLVEPIEFVKRPGYRLGLGATPKDLPVKQKKYIKPGESRDVPAVMVAQAGPDGKVRHVKSISEKLVPLKKGLQPGQLVGIVSGQHEGLYARIVTAGDDDDIVVRLAASNEDLVVSKSDVQPVDVTTLADGHPALKFMIKDKKEREEKERERERERDQRDERDSESYQKKEKKERSSKSSKSDSSTTSSSSSSSSSWIRPKIMVRVVSKSFHNGKYYNKKVSIYDVISRNECVVQLDNGSLLEGVKQRMLETVIPQAGGKIMVLEGANKGKVGRLLERSKMGNKEKAIVEMIGDLNIETFSLDDVAQYVGNFDDESVDMNV